MKGLGGSVLSTAGALLIFALAAAAIAIGWRWGSRQSVPGLG